MAHAPRPKDVASLPGRRHRLHAAGYSGLLTISAARSGTPRGHTVCIFRDEDKAREAFAKLDQKKTNADFLAAARAMLKLPEGNGKLGAVGFCYGGGMVNFLATQVPELAAGVPFYGGQPPADEVPKIKASLLIHYAGEDPRINAGWPAYETALKAAGTRYEAHVYAGAQHGFNNDTTPRFDAAAAKLAWDRTTGFFKRQLA